ncbi:MAG: M28 family peptidase [Candidatus Cryptobacteroides sp.]|nr:M28 family peptidase [Candidatus Cryptobacteroides sp.]
MRKKILNIFIMLCLSGIAVAQSPVDVRNVGVISSKQAHNTIWENKLYRQVEFLSDSLCDGRATGTRGSVEAAFWIARRFGQLGLIPFSGNYTKHFYCPFGRNMLGMIPGSSGRENDSYVIVMAHYDGLGTLGGKLYPGADSNASGVVAMVSVAEMLSAMRLLGRAYSSNIIFAALDAKSSSMKGSRALWDMIEQERLIDPESGKVITADKIRMVVNIDQLGGTSSRLKSGREDFVIILGRESIDKRYGDLFTWSNNRYGIGLELGFDYFGSKDFSNVFYRRVCDQKVFLENGVPSVLFTSGITMNNNKPYDTVDSLNMTVFKKRIWLIFHWIDEIIKNYN